jgi:hypothetical protein
MNTKWLTITSIVVFIYLIIVNAFIFPAVFPDGLAEKFTNTRTESLPLFHVLAFAATAAILTILVDKLGRGHHSASQGLIASAWLGLLVALPEHLHLYAMVDVAAVPQFIPVIWTVATWGLAGLIVGIVGAKVSVNKDSAI